jgi:hypothetical protein
MTASAPSATSRPAARQSAIFEFDISFLLSVMVVAFAAAPVAHGMHRTLGSAGIHPIAFAKQFRIGV